MRDRLNFRLKERELELTGVRLTPTNHFTSTSTQAFLDFFKHLFFAVNSLILY